MTTFHESQPQSRRAVRQSERDSNPDGAPSFGEFADQPEQGSSFFSGGTYRPDAGRASDEGQPAGRRARAAEPPAEPLTYTTQNRSAVPSYDGPSFRNRPAPAVDTPTEAIPAQEAPAYRVRDFSPEGRRSAPAWTPPQAGAKDLDYHTSGSSALASAPPPVVRSAPPIDTPAASPEQTLTRRELRALRAQVDAKQEAESPARPTPATADALDTILMSGPIELPMLAGLAPAEAAAASDAAVSVAASSAPVAPVAPVPSAPSNAEEAPVDAAPLPPAAGAAPIVEQAPIETAAPIADSPFPSRRARRRAEQVGDTQDAPTDGSAPTEPPALVEPGQRRDIGLPPAPDAALETLFGDAAQAGDAEQADGSGQHDDAEQADDSARPDAAERSPAGPIAAAPPAPIAEAPIAEAPASSPKDAPDVFGVLFGGKPPVANPTGEFTPATAAEVEPPVASSPWTPAEEDAAVDAHPRRSTFEEPTPATERQASPFVPPAGHWSAESAPEHDTSINRTVGSGTGATNALVLPHIPEASIQGPIDATGEIILTGSVDLPHGFGATGANPAQLDGHAADQDANDRELLTTDSAPVRAIRAVSSRTSTRNVIAQQPVRKSNRMLGVLIGSCVVLGGSVVGLLVWAVGSGVF